MRLVLIEWEDAVGPQDLETDQLLPPPVAQSVGYLVYQDQQYVTLCPEVFSDLFRACTSIPRGCIRSITDLHMPKRTPEQE